MPRLDGYGFLERWRSQNHRDFIPVILMTGLDDLNSKIRGLNVGADDFILKPINEQELVARVGSLLRLKQMHNELQQSLTDLEKLKVQQDGDYFLTSLLVNPLGFNRVESGAVSVEFFVRQKKTFEFRKWQREIGGDICIADTVELRGAPHVVFLNADAMGKSLQGAGGALVLGAAFGSILQNSANDRLYPEHWLVSVLKTLQDIFEAFNGSMMVSMVLGLVDTRTGMMYYIMPNTPIRSSTAKGGPGFLTGPFSPKKSAGPDEPGCDAGCNRSRKRRCGHLRLGRPG